MSSPSTPEEPGSEPIESEPAARPVRRSRRSRGAAGSSASGSPDAEEEASGLIEEDGPSEGAASEDSVGGNASGGGANDDGSVVEVVAPDGDFEAVNTLLASLVSLGAIALAVLIAFAWNAYGDKHSTGEKFELGASHFVELTLIAEDKHLACASEAELAGLRCGFSADERPRPGADEKTTLRPYRTAGSNTLLLGAGLWTNPLLSGQLPNGRFSVVCNFRVVGAVKSAKLRWGKAGRFDPVREAVPTGVLEGCAWPR